MRDDELYHYRTKGSKNGVSTDPNYTPIGQRAQGPAYMPGSTANRQYREQQQQTSRLQADAAIKRMKSSATNTANSFVSGVNSAANKTATLTEDAAIKRELERRRKEKEKEAERQARREMIDRGVDNLKKSTISGVNSVLQKTGANLRIGKRGVANPYEQGYTGTSRRAKDSTRTNPNNAMNQRIAEARQLREDKTGKNGRLAQAKAYGKEGLAAAGRIARNAKNLPGQAKSRYYMTKANLSRDIDEFKREITANDAYKRVKSGVNKASRKARKLAGTAASKAEHMTYNALEKYTGLNKERLNYKPTTISRPGPDGTTVQARKLERDSSGRGMSRRFSPATREEQVRAAVNKTAESVGAEAERLKKKGLSLLKKLRK